MTMKPATHPPVPVPLLDLKAQYATIRDEITEAINRVVESQHFILGPEVQALEGEVAAYSRAAFGVGVSSGTDALLLALMTIGVGPGDEVITTPYTFFATAGAVARLGATPVFVDIDPLTYNINPTQIEAALSPRTRVVIPVHLYGQVADMDPIMDCAEAHGLTVIEDAAQAIGAEYQGQRAGSIGHMATFSFFPSKNLGGFGDGGMVTTNDVEIDARLRMFRNHGFSPKYFNKVVGGNFRLDALQAAVLRVKLPHLEGWTAARQHNAGTYRRLIIEAGLSIPPGTAAPMSKDSHGVILPTEIPDGRHIYNQFVIRTAQRDQLRAFLQTRDIGTEIYYPCPLHLQECFQYLEYAAGDFPASECAANETLALPIYPELTHEMMETVVAAIAEFFNA